MLCSGGLSNLLYCCWLSDGVPVVGTEPRCVLLRIYGQIIQDHPESVLTDSVIFALLAEKGTGPKLYGVFTSGRLEEYVPVRTGFLGFSYVHTYIRACVSNVQHCQA